MATKFNAAFWKWFGDSKVVDYQDDMLRAAENMGYDGVVMTDPSSAGEAVSLVVFDPKQVWLAGVEKK